MVHYSYLQGLVYYGHVYSHKNKYLFDNFHKYHHQKLILRPFEGNDEHPALIIFFCFISRYIPFLIFRFSQLSFLIYLILFTISGIFDHSGIEFKIPYLYNSKDHALHHAKFNCNYGFPLLLFDVIHGTYNN